MLDFVIGRLLDAEDGTDLRYESITSAPVPVCAVAAWAAPVEGRRCAAGRPGSLSWVLPTPNGLLRHRWEQMFQHAGLELPVSLAETNLQVLVRVLMMQTDALHVMPLEVAYGVAVFRARCRQPSLPARCSLPYGLLRPHHPLRPSALARRAPPVAPRAHAGSRDLRRAGHHPDAATSRHNGSSSLPLASH